MQKILWIETRTSCCHQRYLPGPTNSYFYDFEKICDLHPLPLKSGNEYYLAYEVFVKIKWVNPCTVLWRVPVALWAHGGSQLVRTLLQMRKQGTEVWNSMHTVMPLVSGEVANNNHAIWLQNVFSWKLFITLYLYHFFVQNCIRCIEDDFFFFLHEPWRIMRNMT